PSLRARRSRGEDSLLHRPTRRPEDAVANEPSEPPVVFGAEAVHRLQAGNRPPPLDDQDRGAALDAVDQRAQIVLGFRNAGLFHKAIIAISIWLIKVDPSLIVRYATS